MKRVYFKKINNNSLKCIIGVCLIIFSLICIIDIGPFAQFFTWFMKMLFGILFFIPFLILMLYGFSLIFKKKKIKIKFNFIILGSIFLFLGILLACSFALKPDLTFNDFVGLFNLSEFPSLDKFTGGVIGYFFVAVINSTRLGSIGNIVFGSVFICLGVAFIIGQLLIQYIAYLKEFKKNLLDNKGETIIPVQNVNPDEINFSLHREEEKNIAVTKKEAEIKIKPIIKEQISEIDFAFPLQEEDSKPRQEQFNENKYKQEVDFLDGFTNEKAIEEPVVNNDFLETKEEIITTPSEVQNNFVEEKIITPEQFTTEEPVEVSFIEDTFVEEVNKKEEPITNFYNKVEEQRVVVPENTPTFKEPEIKINLTKLPKTLTKSKAKIDYIQPDLNILEDRSSTENMELNEQVSQERIQVIDQLFEDFGVGAKVEGYTIGPSITRFDIKVDRNVSVRGLDKYMDDLSGRLSGAYARYEPIVMGKTTSGIEIPNKKVNLVNFKDIYKDLPSNSEKLYVPFGKNINGETIYSDLAEFPHMLVCGSTGSGKSIYIHTLILSLLMKHSPESLRLVMIDPKKVEFSKYADMPHLLCPIIIDAQESFNVFQTLVDEMESRFDLFTATGVSNIKQYNQEIVGKNDAKMPYIVVIIDEFADLVEQTKNIITPVGRLAQKARAAGIHMIVATQRPSVNVIQGSIKANIPVRVALLCSSAVDSNTIIGQGGAEKLIGNGDMLVQCSMISRQNMPRIQGAFVSNAEIKNMVDFLKEKYPLEYDEKFLDLLTKAKQAAANANINAMFKDATENDPLYNDIKEYVSELEFISISKLMNAFSLGHTRAERLYSRLIFDGVIENKKTTDNRGAKVLMRNDNSPQNYEPQGSVEQSRIEPLEE